MSEPLNRPSRALGALINSAIDYAGLFPPAKLPMATAVRNHAAYRMGAHAEALGRFVVPLARLPEFEDAYSSLHRTEQSGWRLSVLGGPDTQADWTTINAFNIRQREARIVSVEVRPSSPDEISPLSVFPPLLEVWVEVPGSGPLRPVLDATAQAQRGAKIRMGGVTADAFPPTERVIEFFQECRRLNLTAKATAGLHHPLAGSFPLSYETGAASASMYGFLNLVLAAAHLEEGGTLASAAQLLVDNNAESFRCQDEAILWHDLRFTTLHIERVRRTLVRSFGSCSFNEPIEGLQALGWL